MYDNAFTKRLFFIDTLTFVVFNPRIFSAAAAARAGSRNDALSLATEPSTSDEPSSCISDKSVEVDVREQHHCGLRPGVSCTPDRIHRSNCANTADAAPTTDGRRLCSCRKMPIVRCRVHQHLPGADPTGLDYHEGVTR